MKKKLLTLMTLLASVCSGAWAESETIYSMTAVTGPTGDVTKQTTVDIVATFVGGTAQAYNGKGSASALVSSSGEINLGGSGNSYFHATITGGNTIKEGDIINFGAGGKGYISSSTDAKGSEVTIEATGYVVPSGSNLIGKSEVYYWKSSNSGGMSKFKQFVITRPDESEVNAPVISFSSNTLTITCPTANTTIYYTTDGTAPSNASTEYTAAVALDNPCTVRAIAYNSSNSSYYSVVASKDCYVDNSSADGFLTVLRYNGGTVAGDVWTSSDESYTLTNNVAGRGIGSTNLAGSQDGYKLNHTDNYTLAIPSNIKVTKLVFVGLSWLEGTSTVTVTGFTGDGKFYETTKDGEDYIRSLGSIAFTPDAEQSYGASIAFNPGGTQLGAYIEVYGEAKKYTVTIDDAITNGTVVASASSVAEGETVTLTVTPASGYQLGTLTVTDTESNDVTVTSNQFTMPASNVTVTATFVVEETPIVTLPTETREGYSCTGTTTTPSSSGYTLKGVTVYELSNGGSMTLTVPSTTTISKIVLTGTCKDNNTSTVTITGANSEKASADFTTRTDDICTITFVPTTQTTTYTISSASKGSWVKIAIYGTEETTVAITPAKTTFISYSSDKALNFEGSELKAYVVTAMSEGTVTLSPVTDVPANTGLVLKGNTETYNIPVGTATELGKTNWLQASVTATTVTGSTTLVLSDGIFKTFTGTEIPANKAYILISDYDTAVAGSSDPAPSLGIVIEGDNTTGIENVSNTQRGFLDGDVYNMAGQRVSQPTKGLYIVNGKKVIIK